MTRRPEGFSEGVLVYRDFDGEAVCCPGFVLGGWHMRNEGTDADEAWVVSHLVTAMMIPYFIPYFEACVGFLRALARSDIDWNAITFDDLPAAQRVVIATLTAFPHFRMPGPGSTDAERRTCFARGST